MYRVQVGEQIWRRHADQLRTREEMGTAATKKDNQIEDNDNNFPSSIVDTTKSPNSSGTEPGHGSSSFSSTSQGGVQDSDEGISRYPKCTHKSPNHFTEKF